MFPTLLGVQLRAPAGVGADDPVEGALVDLISVDPISGRFGQLVLGGWIGEVPTGGEAAFLLAATPDERAAETMPLFAGSLGLPRHLPPQPNLIAGGAHVVISAKPAGDVSDPAALLTQHRDPLTLRQRQGPPERASSASTVRGRPPRFDRQ